MKKLKKIKATMKEFYDAMRPNVYKNKKKYTRKKKHSKKDLDCDNDFYGPNKSYGV